MIEHRTGGMTAVAVLNMVCGALFTLVGALMFFGGRFIPFANKGGPAGGFVQFVGLGTAVASLLLLASGLGVMRLAPWGRSTSIAAGSIGVIVYGAAVIGLGPQAFFVMLLGYSFALIFLFMSPMWKVAFSGGSAAPREVAEGRARRDAA